MMVVVKVISIQELGELSANGGVIDMTTPQCAPLPVGAIPVAISDPGQLPEGTAVFGRIRTTLAPGHVFVLHRSGGLRSLE